jgi:hypothetical protein
LHVDFHISTHLTNDLNQIHGSNAVIPDVASRFTLFVPGVSIF